MDTNYGIFTNEDGSKELIELTNEEFDAIVEAREYMDYVDESVDDDEALNEFKDDIKADYAIRRVGEKQSGAHRRGTADYKHTMDEYRKPAKTMEDHAARSISNKLGAKVAKVSTKAQDKKRAENIKKAAKGKEVHTSRYTGRKAAEDFADDNKRLKRNVKKMGKEYISDIKDQVKRHIKESVLDWYDENSIEVDDYEMGRIDSFVENYMEENYSED